MRYIDSLTYYVLTGICRRLVRQGSTHRQNIAEYYRIMRNAAEKEFKEDNKPTLDAFLQECFDESK